MHPINLAVTMLKETIKNMKFKFHTNLMVVTVVSLGTILYLDHLADEQLKVDIKYEQQLLEFKMEEYECLLDSLTSSKLEHKKHLQIIKPDKKSKKSKLNMIAGMSLFKIPTFNACKYIDPIIHSNLFQALEKYSGPKGTITSARRKSCRHSKHFSGRAIDITMNKTGRDMLNYLVSTEGQTWLEESNLSFVIEDKPRSKRLVEFKQDPIFSKYILENRGASGLHIHMWVKS